MEIYFKPIGTKRVIPRPSAQTSFLQPQDHRMLSLPISQEGVKETKHVFQVARLNGMETKGALQQQAGFESTNQTQNNVEIQRNLPFVFSIRNNQLKTFLESINNQIDQINKFPAQIAKKVYIGLTKSTEETNRDKPLKESELAKK